MRDQTGQGGGWDVKLDHQVSAAEQGLTLGQVSCLDWSGDRLAVGCQGGEGAVWSVAGAGVRVATLVGHTDKITAIQFSGSGQRLVTGSEDRTCRVWLADSGDCSQVFRTGVFIDCVAWGSETEFFATLEDQPVGMYQLRQLGPIRSLAGHTDYVGFLAWEPRTAMLASSGDDNTICLWRPYDLSSPPHRATLTGHGSTVLEVAWCPGRPGRLASYDATPEVKIWDVDTASCCFTVSCECDGMGLYNSSRGSIAFSPSGELLAVRGREVQVVRVETGELAAVCRAPAGMLSWSPGGDRLALVTRRAGRWDAVIAFKIHISLKVAAAQAVALSLRREEKIEKEEVLRQLELPNTLSCYLGQFFVGK
jgi:WD40 repeat protein